MRHEPRQNRQIVQAAVLLYIYPFIVHYQERIEKIERSLRSQLASLRLAQKCEITTFVEGNF
jgi:hypothetical protein